MTLFILILYLQFTEVHVPFVGSKPLAILQANAEMDYGPEVLGVDVLDSRGRVIYSIGE